jgi:hypothetical protein
MPRVLINATVALGAYPAALSGVAVAEQACDPSQKNKFSYTGESKDMLVAHNTDSGAHDVTVTSVVDSFNRPGDLVKSVAAGEIAVFGPFKSAGWKQASESFIYCEAPDALVKFGKITLP